jgi:DNA-binding response OmpR family regulator
MSIGTQIEPRATSDRHAKKRVLIVDDDATIRMLLQIGLRLRGFECLMAENGLAAQQILQENHPDLIVVDLMMPMMDGLAFIQWLRQTAHNGTPVLVLSSVNNPQITQDALQSGANGFAHKPVRIHQFLDELTKLAAN